MNSSQQRIVDSLGQTGGKFVDNFGGVSRAQNFVINACGMIMPVLDVAQRLRELKWDFMLSQPREQAYEHGILLAPRGASLEDRIRDHNDAADLEFRIIAIVVIQNGSFTYTQV